MNPSEKLMEDAREEYARKGVLRQEYHRGYEAGKRARTPEQWQLDMERMEVARRIDAVTLDNGSHGNLSAIASAIYEPKFGWTSGACAMLRDKLVRLLGGAHERDCRGGRDDTGAPRADNSDGEQAEEVNHLGGGEPTLSDLWGVWNSEDESQDDTLMRVSLKAKTYAYQILDLADILGVNVNVGDNVADIGNAVIAKARQLTDECNFSTPENYMDAEDVEPNPEETSGAESDHVSFGTGSDTNGTMGQTNGTCPNDGPTSSITDERHKAVCRLRKVCTELSASVWTWVEDVAIAIGAQDGPNDEYESMLPKITYRLIHLLSGNEPNFAEIAETINLGDESDSELMENGENHKIATITDELREWIERQDNDIKEDQCWILPPYDERELLAELAAIADRIDARHHLTSIVAEASTSDEWTTMSEYDKVRRQRDELRVELEELRRQSRTCPKSDEEVSESAPSITDELRVWAHGLSDPWKRNVEAPLLAIADRIDEQFDRICEQHEAVLQSTIDEMCDELSGLEENNAELTAKCKALMAANAGLAKGIDDARESEYRAERQRDELRDKFAEYDLQSRLEEQGDITMTHREMRRMLGEVKHLHDTLRARSNAMSQVTKERDELRRTCVELRRELEGGQHG